jgi:hypothetical protein
VATGPVAFWCNRLFSLSKVRFELCFYARRPLHKERTLRGISFFGFCFLFEVFWGRAITSQHCWNTSEIPLDQSRSRCARTISHARPVRPCAAIEAIRLDRRRGSRKWAALGRWERDHKASGIADWELPPSIRLRRVPRVYLTSAFRAILAILASFRISNLRVFNGRGRSESRRPRRSYRNSLYTDRNFDVLRV